jgi:hypothetical protein
MVPFLEQVLPACPIRALLGVPCPGCGMTRAFLLCIQGDVATSLGVHPLAPVVLSQALVLSAIWLWAGIGSVHLVRLKSVVKRLASVNCLLLLIIWAYRVSTGLTP